MHNATKDKKAAVTGAARGIGRAIALKLAREGADVIVADINLEGVQKVAEEIKNMGRKAVDLKVDVSIKEEAEKIINTAKDELGRLDILVNNAGINRDAMLHKMSDEDWEKVLAVDLTGVFFCTRAAAKLMRDQGYGRIINISSASWMGNIGQANYSAAKAGVVGFSKTAARELARKGITVNVICPGFIDTEMTRAVPDKVRAKIMEKIPMGEVGKPEDVANAVAFLASDEARYITGAIIDVGGGMVL
ncbi:MAG TPA: 3-oxoacyl-ACP reductase FabG [Candidatus Aerophobetes bacterium]|uniref:3-oxoacyl-[acyl-carrier-protein] reductase n=1 Tax=Aerophobetes bacterium TaxID=2030807 RepID=A0A7V0QSA6_UNCAE|nr:3-oxoacyl-ACP reductase FabG [Candidatus Aerophobetes bacterium]